MEEKEIKNLVEAMLFSTGRDMSIMELANYMQVPYDKVEKAILILQNEYKEENRGIQIININEAYQMVSNKIYYEYIVKLFNDNRKATLSNAAIEVLSIIAYNSDITRAEIEKIRGVNSDGGVNRLLEYNLIEESGRLDLPGRPAIYRVTDDFLRTFGLNTIEDLPELPQLEIVKDVRENNDITEEISKDSTAE